MMTEQVGGRDHIRVGAAEVLLSQAKTTEGDALLWVGQETASLTEETRPHKAAVFRLLASHAMPCLSQGGVYFPVGK